MSRLIDQGYANNPEKYYKKRREEQTRWRKATGSGKYGKRPWTPEEIDLVLAQKMPDRELGNMIHRSVSAIYEQRSKLRRKKVNHSMDAKLNIMISLPSNLVTRLQSGETIEAKTDYSNPYSPTAYRDLSKISGYPNFFFGLDLSSDTIDHLRELCGLSNDKNNKLIILHIPQKDGYLHNYYDFSDLIYYLESEPNQQYVDDILESLKNPKYQAKYPRQFVFPRLKPEYLK